MFTGIITALGTITQIDENCDGRCLHIDILELAQESEMPRAYEVAGQLIKNVADATDKLLTLQQKLKDVSEEKDLKGPTTVNNALFVGSTADLAKMLKDGLKEEDK